MRLLIFDDHDRHITIELMETCVENDILRFGRPTHITHLLQPPDVGLLGPLQEAYVKAVDDA